MIDLLQSVLYICGSWAVLAAVFVGIGLPIARVFREPSIDAEAINRAVWIGLAVAVLVLTAWNLVAPIGPVPGAVLAVCGGVGLLMHADALARFAVGALRRRPIAIAVFVLACLWIADRSIGPLRHIDAEIYHAHAIAWATQFPAVPGLGNLHDRLAFNNTNHLVAAAMESTLWLGRSHHILNGLFVVLIAAMSVSAGARLLDTVPGEEPDRTAARRASAIFPLLLIAPTVSVAVTSNISSNNTDFPPSAALFVVIAWILFDALDEAPGLRAVARASAAICVAALAATFKVSHMPFAGLLALLVIGVWAFRSGSIFALLRSKAFLFSVVLSALLTLAWLVRGVILSGHLLYPVLGPAFDLDWAISSEQRETVRALVAADSRRVRYAYGEELAGFGWVYKWIVGQLASVHTLSTTLPMTVSLLAAAGAAGLRALRVATRVRTTLLWGPLVVTLFAVAVWLLQAPMPRMGGHVFWVLAGISACALVAKTRLPSGRLFWAVVVMGALVLGASPIAGAIALSAMGQRVSTHNEFGPLYIPPAPRGGLHATPVRLFGEFTTRSNLVLAYPLDDHGLFGRPIMSTPFPAHRLALRDPSNVAKGFRVLPGPGHEPEQSAMRSIADLVTQHAGPDDRFIVSSDAEQIITELIESGRIPSEKWRERLQVATAADVGPAIARARGARLWLIVADGPKAAQSRGDLLQVAFYLLSWTAEERLVQLHKPGVSAMLFALPK